MWLLSRWVYKCRRLYLETETLKMVWSLVYDPFSRRPEKHVVEWVGKKIQKWNREVVVPYKPSTRMLEAWERRLELGWRSCEPAAKGLYEQKAKHCKSGNAIARRKRRSCWRGKRCKRQMRSEDLKPAMDSKENDPVSPQTLVNQGVEEAHKSEMSFCHERAVFSQQRVQRLLSCKRCVGIKQQGVLRRQCGRIWQKQE